MNSLTRTLVLSTALGCAGAAHAEPVNEQIRSCSAEAEATARLDCYDQVAARLNKVAAPSNIPVPDASGADTNTAVDAAAPSAPAATTAAPGAGSPADAPKTADTAGKSSSKTPGVGAVVAGVARRPRGELVVTLDNGQVWVQLEAVEHDPLKAGDVVRISRNQQGTSMMSTPANHSTRVKRLL